MNICCFIQTRYVRRTEHRVCLQAWSVRVWGGASDERAIIKRTVRDGESHECGVGASAHGHERTRVLQYTNTRVSHSRVHVYE
jgi:hypothetical protein